MGSEAESRETARAEAPEETRADPAGGGASSEASWGQIWQVPVAIAAGVMLLGGLLWLTVSRPGPDVAGMLDASSRLLGEDRPSEALTLLNTEVRPLLEAAEHPEAARGRFHLLRARALAHAQRKLGVERAENHGRVTAEFEQAERWGASLTPEDVSILTESLIAMERYSAALRRAAMLPEQQGERAAQILRRVIEAQLASGGAARDDEAMALLRELLRDESLDERERAWATARQAELLIERGDAEGAIARILRLVPRLESGNAAGLGELLVILSRAYLETGAVEEAEANATRTLELLAESEPMGGEASLILAQVDEQRGRVREARERYDAMVDQFRGHPVARRGLLGVAETAAVLGDDQAALGSYETLVDRIEEAGGAVRPDLRREAIVGSLLARYGDRLSAGHVDRAIEYAKLAERLYGLEDAPDELLRALAEAHRRRAMDVLKELGTGLDRLLDLAELDPSVRERVRRDLVAAGSYYRLYADRVVLTDAEAYADALWLAADSFDHAGDREQAMAGFQEFAREVADDPRTPEASYRLAQAKQASGAYGEAAAIYSELIEGGTAETDKGVGAFANLSFVPLAQTYLLDGNASNDEEAERLLRRVVSGRVGMADSPYFAEALIELGRFLFERGRYPEAIEKLEEALARYPNHERAEMVRYKLAEARRLEASAIAETLEAAAPEAERRALAQARRDHLRRAIDLYTGTIEALEGIERQRRTALESVRLRNARFYRGACAFDLGDYEEARRFYENAREAYPEDPSSLVSLVQVVNTYVAEKKWSAARAAQERAKRFYASLPEDVWEDPNLPLRREDWERWLASTSALAGLAEADGGGS